MAQLIARPIPPVPSLRAPLLQTRHFSSLAGSLASAVGGRRKIQSPQITDGELDGQGRSSKKRSKTSKRTQHGTIGSRSRSRLNR
ncbi:hypothetical protein NL676_010347 [Syzygium grande]|nr:hypothetical protein NL676_010347 [Syzygium grande]